MNTLDDVKDCNWTDRHLLRLIAFKRTFGPGAWTLEASHKVFRLDAAIRYLHSRRRRRG